MLRPRTIADVDKEAVLAERLSAFLDEERSLSGPIIRELDGLNLRFAIIGETNGITEAGMVLFDQASLHLPRRHVTLGCHGTTGRRVGETLIDWIGDRRRSQQQGVRFPGTSLRPDREHPSPPSCRERGAADGPSPGDPRRAAASIAGSARARWLDGLLCVGSRAAAHRGASQHRRAALAVWPRSPPGERSSRKEQQS